MRFAHRLPTARPAARELALACVASLLLLAQPALAAEVEGNRVDFGWTPASGPVAGYHVFVTRNGVGSGAPEQSVSGTSASVTGALGDDVVVRVAAFDSAGTRGPLSSASEAVTFIASSEPPPLDPEPSPGTVVFESSGDTTLYSASAAAAPGEQVTARLTSDGKVLLDAALPEDVEVGDGLWGIDQLVVGTPDQPTTVRMVDSIGLDTPTPMASLPQFTLFGLGAGDPCDRDGEPGLVIHAGSRLVLGGLELHAFDGERCIHVNELFAESRDPNRVEWGDGEILLHGDLEEDGVLDDEDNCLLVSNPDQCDTDVDGFGNQCDYDVDQNGRVTFKDWLAVLAAATEGSRDGRFDVDCDGGATIKDLVEVQKNAYTTVGPTGLACAADASCESP